MWHGAVPAGMPRLPQPKMIELEGEYYHVRFRDPDEFGEIRTPQWAVDAASDVVRGSKVRTGRGTGGEWVVQSVLIPKAVGKTNARRHARTILEEIET